MYIYTSTKYSNADISAYARIAPGDTFEVFIRHGQQKLKCKGKVLKDGKQNWENRRSVFKCMLDEPLHIKVQNNNSTNLPKLHNNIYLQASETRIFGKAKVLSEQPFDPIQLFSAVPQMLTMNLNHNGSIKLKVLVIWKLVPNQITAVTRQA